MRYQPPFAPNWPNVANPNAPYINGNPPAGIKGSVPPASAIEYTMREVVHLIQKGGYVPADPVLVDPAHDAADPNDPNLFQLTQGARRALYAWGIDTGSTNSLNVALDPPLMAYAQGLEIRVLVANDNTAACTIRVNGLSTQQIVKKDGSTLMAGDMRRGGIAVLVHDGSNFQLVSGAAGSTTIFDGWFNGADYIVDVGTPNHIIGTPAIAPTALAAGQSFLVLVKYANISTINGGAVDINVNSLGAKSVVLPTGLPLVAADIVPNMLIRISYDGSKFTMLSPIDTAIVETALTKIVGPNTGADFPNLNDAMEWLSRRRIDKIGSVTFSLQGQATGSPIIHSYTSDIIINHPDGQRLSIIGAGMNFIPVSANFAANSTSSIQADAATNAAYLRTAFQSEIRFTTANSMQIQGRLGLLKNVLVAGPAMTGAIIGGSINVHGHLTIDTVASIQSAGLLWGVYDNGTLDGKNMYASGSGTLAIGLSQASTLVINRGEFIVANSLGDGIQATLGAVIHLNSQAGGGQTPKIWGCVGCGINHWGSSSLHAQSLSLFAIGSAGVLTSGAIATVQYATASNCYQGFLVSQGGEMDASSTSTSGISAGDYTAAHGSFMYAASFQNGSAQFSPARNTVGNANAYIEA